VLQTAQGAMNQITSILQKMSTLALQAANGGATDSTAQAADDAEFQALSSQIDQIANTTSFGNHNLLDGSYTNQTFQIGSNNSATNQVSVSIASLTSANLLTNTTTTDTLTGSSWVESAGAVTLGADGVTGTVNYTPTGGSLISHGFRLAHGETLADIQTEADTSFGAGQVTASFSPGGALVFTSSTGALAEIGDNGLMGSPTLVTADSYTPANPVLTSTSGAQAAITAVQAALSAVSTKAGGLGALQNEMTSVVANLTVGQQNLQAADSQITDTNMASEMTNFTSDQVLEQAGVAMLSQAQQSSQYVLKLLQ
jgi:flagellin